MLVDEWICQFFGILYGGVMLVLVEIVVGLGLMIFCQFDEIVVGMQVSGNYMLFVYEGDIVCVVGIIIYKGCLLYVWNVDVFMLMDKLVFFIWVVNSILKKR